MLQGISLKRRGAVGGKGGRERERKKDTGTKALMQQDVLINMVWAYILSYKAVVLNKDKD